LHLLLVTQGLQEPLNLDLFSDVFPQLSDINALHSLLLLGLAVSGFLTGKGAGMVVQ